MIRRVPLLLAALLAAAPALAQTPDAQPAAQNPATKPHSLVIGAGPAGGVYFPAAGAIQRLVNRDREQSGLRLLVESTGGSIPNIEALRSGDIDLAIVQSDWQFQALNGSSIFESAGAMTDLRVLFSLQGEALSLVVKADSPIKSPADLKGRRVYLGQASSASRAMVRTVLEAYGLDDGALVEPAENAVADQPGALCGGALDALFLSISHPNGRLVKAALTCPVRIVPLTGPQIDELLASHPYYAALSIPGGLYKGIDGDTATIGITATVITRATLPDADAYTITKTVFDHLDELRQQHPALAGLSADDMASDGLTAQTHDGAAKALAEAGLMPQPSAPEENAPAAPADDAPEPAPTPAQPAPAAAEPPVPAPAAAP